MKNVCNTFCSCAAALGLFLLSASVAVAQEKQPENQTRKVRIKIIETKDGVQTMRDTVMEVSNSQGIPDISDISRWRSDLKLPENAEQLPADLQKRIRVVAPDGTLPDVQKLEGVRFKAEQIKDLQTENIRVLKVEKAGSVVISDSLIGKRLMLVRQNLQTGEDLENMRVQVLDRVKLLNNENPELLRLKADSLVKFHRVIFVLTELNETEKQMLQQSAKKEVPAGKLKDLELEELELYPNPSTGVFNLSFTLEKKASALITVRDASGREVYRENLNRFKGRYNKELDLSRQSKGIYFLQIISDNQVFNKKLLLQ
ncbi:MAG: T9SS type A sorting domain-containing protein [Hymenobacteraceae bacterium]|nr:T9SS type A sorting domain-containing protein [Hymenobacteraceae bacterium]MDX5394697.1 T9SS type A sorting domain-containing protein [Hymenobacteraceae bacterium]MDX5443134.1 T9SS type A sorting domain-containing protein [Hymenobacteraceae bacterium]MDX5510730.1 T9SS type A sorting domain-containing protein [Hymenobacteraceae bacterium]